jgi:hypothetical protein
MKRGIFLLFLLFIAGCEYYRNQEIGIDVVDEPIIEEVLDVEEDVIEKIPVEIIEIPKLRKPKLENKEYFDVCDKFKIEEGQRRNYISMHYVLLDVCNDLDEISEITGQEPWEFYLVRFNNSKAYKGVYGFYTRGTGIITITVDNPKNSLLRPVLVHELSHSFTDGLRLPTWLDEGIAEYVKEEITGSSYRVSEYVYNLAVWNDNLRSSFIEREVELRYGTSAYVVREMIDWYGEVEFKEMITEIKDIERGEYEFDDARVVFDFIEKKYGKFNDVRDYVVSDEDFLKEWYSNLYRRAWIRKSG